MAAAPGEVSLALVGLGTGERIGIDADVVMHAASSAATIRELSRIAWEGLPGTRRQSAATGTTEPH